MARRADFQSVCNTRNSRGYNSSACYTRSLKSFVVDTTFRFTWCFRTYVRVLRTLNRFSRQAPSEKKTRKGRIPQFAFFRVIRGQSFLSDLRKQSSNLSSALGHPTTLWYLTGKTILSNRMGPRFFVLWLRAGKCRYASSRIVPAMNKMTPFGSVLTPEPRSARRRP